MNRVIALFSLLCLTAPLAMAQSLAERLGTLIDTSPVTARTFVAMQVADAETGEILFERCPDNLFTPASNVKLYTSACALDTWGPDHTFDTHLGVDGDIEDGILHGDLILFGDGDPVLTSEDLRTMAQRVRSELGIERITGGVVVNDSRVDPVRKGPGWMWDDDPDVYNMSLASLMLDYNVLTAEALGLSSGDERDPFRLVPPSAYPPIEWRPSSEGSTEITRQPFRDVIEIRGGGSASRHLTMHDPAQWIAGVLHQMLIDEGIEVEGRPLVETLPPVADPGISHESLPLSDIIALFNKPSENAIGEMLLLDLAAETAEGPVDFRDGAARLTEWLTREAGLDPGDFNLVDGSGLSRYDLICASGTVDLLLHMWQHPHRQVYVDSLPIAGVDGSLRSRMGGTPAVGRVHAKTGTMSGVSCLSGYAETVQGQWLVFSILTNGHIGSSAPSRGLQDRLCVALVE
ncbi:D-alanyl-D-alanine carboxypeptidase/D-alanyl-D-alanine-endopeptidase [Candidatus Sumerlaeota bacterium]|nr:D-alanyl-D-alanine carboxypeptidase/D-alanyl-D-alanine-endopeptidase [Candidatus Sumerlaeota bacterium]